MADITVPAKKGVIVANGTQVLDVKGSYGGSKGANTLYVGGSAADFGAATVAVEVSPEPETGNWFPYADSFTESNFFIFSSRFPYGGVRLKVTGAAGAVNIPYWVL